MECRLTEWMKQNDSSASPDKRSNNFDTLLQNLLFGYLSKATPDSEILKQDNTVLYSVTKSGISDSPDVANRFCLRCILEAIKEIIEVIIKHLPD